jgi:prepilin-type N-terminal cleavage/methylation domain-containing protein
VNTRSNSQTRNGKPRRHRGFSMIETMVVVVIGTVLTAAAIVQLNQVLQEQQATAASDQVKSTLRLARETAVSTRRIIVVQFINKNQISLFELTPGSSVLGTAIITTTLGGASEFITYSAEVDTPDGFSPSLRVPDGIYFAGVDGGPTGGMEFQPDGTFTNSTGNPINGTVFLGEPGFISSARAVTLLGYTGKIHSWRPTGNGSATGWIQ